MPLNELRRRERVDEACSAIAYYQSSRAAYLTPAQRDMLASDYASRRGELRQASRLTLDEVSHALHSNDPAKLSDSVKVDEPPAQAPIDIGILTVTRTELTAVCDVFRIDIGDFREFGGLYYYNGAVEGRRANRGLSVVVSKANGPGQLAAAEATRELVREYGPGALFLVGIAGGRRGKVALCDVVVPKIIHAYEGERREPDVTRPRHEVLNVPREVFGNLLAYYPTKALRQRLSAFRSRIPTERRPPIEKGRRFKPTFHIENVAIACGEVLAADGRFIEELRAYEDRIHAIDQESYGFGLSSGRTWFGIFRGISDYADAEKTDTWQYLAAGVAAMYLRDFLERVYLPADARNL
jgi:nucleoside phosphorylase